MCLLPPDSLHLISFLNVQSVNMCGAFAFTFGVSVRPASFTQYWLKIKWSLPNGKQVYDVGLAAICWAIWKTRNAICFEGKRTKSPTEIICLICSLLTYWAWCRDPEVGGPAVSSARSEGRWSNVKRKMEITASRSPRQTACSEDVCLACSLERPVCCNG